MIKIVRHIMGGTWFKIQSTSDSNRQYWIRPTQPDAVEKLASKKIIKAERYDHCLLHDQCTTPI